MEDLVKRVNEELVDESTIHQELLYRYRDLCGDYGGRVFESRILPALMIFYNISPVEAVIRGLEIIEAAADCQPDGINGYLYSVRIPQNKPQQREPLKDEHLDHSLRRLRSWVVIYNNGRI